MNMDEYELERPRTAPVSIDFNRHGKPVQGAQCVLERSGNRSWKIAGYAVLEQEPFDPGQCSGIGIHHVVPGSAMNHPVGK